MLTSQVVYSLTNRWPTSVPQVVPLTGIDFAIPLIPWTVFVYIGDLPLCVSAYIALSSTNAKRDFARAFAAVFAVGIGCFLVFPTTYPRELFPVPSDASDLARDALVWVRAADAPTNAFPSLHVACCYLAALMFRGMSRRRFWFYFIWASAITASTLTTKQHAIADVVAGALLAVLGYCLVARCHGLTRWADGVCAKPESRGDQS